MKVSVVVPAYNEEAYIETCLASILSQTEKPYEVIVVDNNSTDTTAVIAASFPEVTVITCKQQGMIPARNTGFNYASGDIIARTDADTKVPHTWIKKINKRFTDDPDLLALSGPARFEKIPKVVQPKNWPTVGYNATFRQTVRHDVLFGPNMALRKTIWNKVRDEVCMDDQIVHEDMDLALHIAPYGKILFDNKLIVVSSPRRWQKLMPYIEYPYRYLRTIQHHLASIHHLRKNTYIANAFFYRTKQLFKKVKQIKT